jgi:cytoskeletal protein CcmA (bactofilin family)
MKGFKSDGDDGSQGRISRGVQISGDVLFADMLYVEGKVIGKVTSESGLLHIEQSGEVQADIDVGICVIRGSVKGNVNCKSRAEIYKTGRVEGDVNSPVLLVEEGALLSGVISMSNEVALSRRTDAASRLDPVEGAELRKVKGAS